MGGSETEIFHLLGHSLEAHDSWSQKLNLGLPQGGRNPRTGAVTGCLQGAR